MQNIGIIVAMDKELEPILEYCKNTKTILEFAKYTFIEAMVQEQKVTLVYCGVGKTNATMAAQIMIDKLGVDALISTGVAGGLDDNLKSFDVVIAEKTCFHDIPTYFLENYTPNCSTYVADDKFLEIAKKSNPNAYCGLIVSGDSYISTQEQRNKIISEYSPLACDMESASIGLCAYRNGVPFISIRSISDNADEATTADPDAFERIAAKQSADFIDEFMKNLK